MLLMPRGRRLALYAIGIGAWLSGGLWLLSHYVVADREPFGRSAIVFEPWWLKLHGAFAFAAIWMFGLLWGTHVAAGWSGRRRYLSGGLLAGLLLWLIVSGYLLYYAGGEATRSAVSLAHWLTGLAAPLGFVAHRLRRKPESARHGTGSSRLIGRCDQPSERYSPRSWRPR